MIELSAEQQAIVDAPLAPLAVIACAGSGKPRTAVHRLSAMRRLLGDARGRVALLSFSNVAVDTFRKDYQTLAQALPASVGRNRVDIDTLDGFITGNVLRSHAHRTMGATQAAYLVTGSEPFLGGFAFKPEKFPLPITEMQVGFRNGQPYFYYAYFDQVTELETAYASRIVDRLGRTGAYTHNLGRYWCYRTLLAQPSILKALARRYPYIVVDESQDIGSSHQAILELLVTAGVQISLIGDPHQGIYAFAGADGTFLGRYRTRASGVAAYSLTRNYRSVPSILALANSLSGRNDTAERQAGSDASGPFLIGYSKATLPQLIDAFHSAVKTAGLSPENSAILCRGRPLANELAGIDAPVGQGLVKGFVAAAVQRDRRRDYLSAFKTVAGCVIALLDAPPQGLLSKLTQPALYPEMRCLRRCLWRFTRNADIGLPSSELIAAQQWHALLLKRVKTLLANIETEFGFASVDNLGRKLAKTGLPDAPLAVADDLAVERDVRIRVDTVHQVKGESLDAVLYVATKEHVQAMLGGVNSELGRIGYVAVTRAKNLLWLGVPASSLKELKPVLLAVGFREIGAEAEKDAQAPKAVV